MKGTPETRPMSDVEAIEYCLHVLYGDDRTEQAMRLIERFGSAASIFDASVEELTEMPGITARAAMFFTTAKQIRRQALLRAHGTPVLDSPRGAAQYAAIYFMNRQVKTELCVCLDNNYRVICAEKPISDSRVRETVALVCERNAQKIMFMSYEPRLKSKRVLPPIDMRKTLIKLNSLLCELGVEIVDCIDYMRFECSSVRCAAAGKAHIFGVDCATDAPYAKMPPLSATLQTYLDGCADRAR